MTNRLIDIAVVGVLSVLVSGCLTTTPVPTEMTDAPCTEYPTLDDLDDRWDSMSNDSMPGWRTVAFVAGGWRLNRTEMPQEQIPATFMEWSDYPKDDQPPLIRDALCHSAMRIRDSPHGSDVFASRVFAPEWLVHETLDEATAEYERQTGTSLDWRASQWPFLLFDDHFYEIYCQGFYKRTENGSTEVECPPTPEE